MLNKEEREELEFYNFVTNYILSLVKVNSVRSFVFLSANIESMISKALHA